MASMSGHTRFSALIGFEADGKRFAHVGDQYFFQRSDEQLSADHPLTHSFVYRNGALLDGYEQSEDWLSRWQSNILIGGHIKPTPIDDQFLAMADDWAREYRERHQQAMPLSETRSANHTGMVEVVNTVSEFVPPSIIAPLRQCRWPGPPDAAPDLGAGRPGRSYRLPG
jgi:hypothetical protein